MTEGQLRYLAGNVIIGIHNMCLRGCKKISLGAVISNIYTNSLKYMQLKQTVKMVFNRSDKTILAILSFLDFSFVKLYTMQQ